MSSYLLTLLAGSLTVLLPCVLPLLPIVLAAAASRSRFGPLATIAGLTLSSAALGFALATIGRGLGVQAEILRQIGGGLLLLIGGTFLSARLQQAATGLLAPVSAWAGSRAREVDGGGVAMQFATGALTGLVWSPCAGPSLGAAVGLAMQADTLLQSAAEMLLFSLGAALPLLLLAQGARKGLAVRQAALARSAKLLKPAAGVLFVLVGGLTLTGGDHRLEALLVANSPAWLTDLTTRY